MGEKDRKEKEVQAAAQPVAGLSAAQEMEQIFRDHHKRVYQAAYRVTGNAMDAEDAVQTVFMRLVRRKDRTHLSENPGSYLHRAAINASLDIIRAKKNARSSSIEEFAPAMPDPAAASPERDQTDREIREVIRAALTSLNPRTSEVFVLRYFEGYGNHEIATMLGTSRSTIAVMLHRARIRLKEEIRSLAGDML
ncbi:MAG: sigma-70 family RNA polymerase sigma factor [Acidobacteria bacterium]|uniref:Sigma-70 family RNA polymerase sigma factor n=1 Tax=Candidatus Polarisedimenticola svalbardensis TaxID=2886004 RepID=A0A8J6XX44_9BACT|nr:sigma-70 family RNA polymerase sigma factor [Candidatus Polarisedimenticola svalbardensis]